MLTPFDLDLGVMLCFMLALPLPGTILLRSGDWPLRPAPWRLLPCRRDAVMIGEIFASSGEKVYEAYSYPGDPRDLFFPTAQRHFLAVWLLVEVAEYACRWFRGGSPAL